MSTGLYASCARRAPECERASGRERLTCLLFIAPLATELAVDRDDHGLGVDAAVADRIGLGAVLLREELHVNMHRGLQEQTKQTMQHGKHEDRSHAHRSLCAPRRCAASLCVCVPYELEAHRHVIERCIVAVGRVLLELDRVQRRLAEFKGSAGLEPHHRCGAAVVDGHAALPVGPVLHDRRHTANGQLVGRAHDAAGRQAAGEHELVALAALAEL